MKHFYLFYTLLFTSFTFSALAQKRAIMQGECINENGQPIENVSVYVRDSTLITVTDANGLFTYYSAKTGDKLRFAHMAYETTYYTIKEKDLNGDPVEISMNTKKHELHEVEITANAPSIAFDNPVTSTLDYVIRDDGIFMIAYRRKNNALIHLSFDLDTLHEMKIPSDLEMLYKDFYNGIRIFGNKSAYLVDFTEQSTGEKTDMKLCGSMSRDRFLELFSPILAASDSIVIYARYAFYYSEQYFYCVTPEADTVYLLNHVVDEERRDNLLLQLRTGMDDFTMFSMLVHSTPPMYNPIYGIDNKFYLFAFTDHETIIYDAVGHELERHPLTFHEYKKWNGKMVPDKSWRKKVLVDEGTKKFYTYTVTDGLTTIKRINIETGTAEPIINLRGYPFAEKLRVYNGMLYFLYPTGINNRRALYRVKLE